MELAEITNRTKAVIREWSQPPASMSILLDDLLLKFRPNAQDELRNAINTEFAGANGIPISNVDWGNVAPNTVRSVRDLVNVAINGE